MKVSILSFFISILLFSCAGSQKITASSILHQETEPIPKIDTLLVFRATGSSREVNIKVSSTLEWYLEDYFKLALRDSFLELIQSMGIYQIPEEYSSHLLSKIYQSTKVRYIMLPKISIAQPGISGYEGYGYSRAQLSVSYELHDMVLKKPLFTVIASSLGEWSTGGSIAADVVTALITREQDRNRIDNRTYYRAAPLESLFKPLSLEVTNKLRSYLKIKHKYADLK